MQQHEFYNTAELEEVSNELARASTHPMFVDLGQNYDRDPDDPTTESRHQEGDVVVWNNREDRQAYVGSPQYELVQHREVIDEIREAVAQTTGTIDFGMIRDYGEKVDGLLVFGNQDQATIDMEELLGDDYIAPGQRPDTDPRGEESQWRDTIGLGMRFKNSFDGGTKVQATTMGYRYVCQNWMVWSEQQIDSAEHIHREKLDADFFARGINQIFDVAKEVQPILVNSAETELPVSWVPSVLEDAGFGRNYRINIMSELDADEISGETTLWELYNAITSYLDHQKASDVGNGVYDSHQERAWNVLTLEDIERPDDEPEDLEEITA